MSEDEGVIGERGVYFAKQWLESTTHFDVPHTAYDLTTMTTLPLMPHGKKKKYDLAGRFLGSGKSPIICEVKTTASEAGQGPEYRQFLANCYSASYREHKEEVDPERHYMWITQHPFLLGKWPKLTSVEYMLESLGEHPETIDNADVDQEFARKLVDRLWIIVLSEPLRRLMLTSDELYQVRGLLKRDES